MTTYFVNSLSPGMFPSEDLDVRLRPASAEVAAGYLHRGFTSAVGHPATAAALSIALGIQVPEARVAVTMAPGDVLIVAGIVDRATGEPARLPEGKVLDEADLAAFEFKFRAATCAAHAEPAQPLPVQAWGDDLVSLADRIGQGHRELTAQLDWAPSRTLAWAEARVRELGLMLQAHRETREARRAQPLPEDDD
jgi:hypothetical protein